MKKSKDDKWKYTIEDFLLNPKKFKFGLKDL